MNERDLFLAAVEISDPVQRAQWLAEQCGPDDELRRRVEELLRASAAAGEFLEEPAAGIRTTPDRPQDYLGAVIAGKYKLLQVIGEGGMGAVYMADQLAPVKRRVAVKLIKAGLNSGQVLARFEAERQALALMDHPNIAKVLDAGTINVDRSLRERTDSRSESATLGRPFFVMELVKGIPLTEFADQHHLSVGERLTLFRQICSAVHHAHQKGIIHRDLKPSNILVESHDGKPVPKVIDFGLAKATTGVALTEHTLFTALGQVAGTPLYMAPEQAAFNAIDVDTRADIYALGVILYELLTGSTPIERATLKKAAFDEVLRMVREHEPPTPSKRLSSSQTLPSIAANRQSEPAKLGRFVRGELDWHRAIAYDRLERYAESKKDWDNAIELSPMPERPGVRASRATSRLQAGQVAEAVAEVAELTQSSNWNALQWYNFACAYAVASSKIADKKHEYTDRAMELLQRAVKVGWKDAAHMEKDKDLDSLRGREDFKKLMEVLKK